MRILVLNGPNLNRLGTREPEVYGRDTLDDVNATLREAAGDEFEIDARQSNHEGDLVTWLQEAADLRAPVILNAAAYTHTSVALHDAVKLVVETGAPVVEVHLSNPHHREPFRHVNFVSPAATGSIAGFGAGSYLAALAAIRHHVGRDGAAGDPTGQALPSR